MFLQTGKVPYATARKSYFFKKNTQLHDQVNSMRGINPELAHLYPQSVMNCFLQKQKETQRKQLEHQQISIQPGERVKTPASLGSVKRANSTEEIQKS